MAGDRVITFKGRDIRELEKPELIEAVEWAMGELEREKRFHATDLDMTKLWVK